MKNVLIALCLILTISSVGYSQNTFEFLRLDASPRVSAMGGNITSYDDDPNVMFFNPAGLAFQQNTQGSFSFLKYLNDVNMAGLAISRSVADWGTFGVGLKYINYGSFDGADENGNLTGDFSAGEMVLQGSYANYLKDEFSYGVTAKIIYSSIASYTSSAVAIDAGLNYAIASERINFGFSLMNLGTQISKYNSTKEDLPFDIRFGVSKRLLKLPLKFSLDFPRLNRKDHSLSENLGVFTVGGELTASKYVKIRAGYDNQKRKDLKIGDFAGLSGFSLGFGITVKNYVFSYGFSSFGEIGGVHRIGINSDLDIF